jgi:hypothetical protein
MDQKKIQEILESNATKNFVQRILNPEIAPTPLDVDGQKQTHFMRAEYLGKEDTIPAVFPTVIEREGELFKFEDLEEAKDHARKTGEYIEFKSIEEADLFSREYKGDTQSDFNQFYSPEEPGLMNGGVMNNKKLKPIPKNNKGLSKLPKEVRNKMGYLYHGGMMGMMPEMVVGYDEESGNPIPPGSDAENVRDDIPAALSEGELVIPADVVRYHGLKTYEDMRIEAKMGLMSMKAEGQIVDIEEEDDEEYDEEMSPTDHVQKNEDTGMYCVYDVNGKKVKEFKTKKEADDYAKKNHDELMATEKVEEAEVEVEEEGMELKEDSEGVEAYPSKENDEIDMMEIGDKSVVKLFIKGLMGR